MRLKKTRKTKKPAAEKFVPVVPIRRGQTKQPRERRFLSRRQTIEVGNALLAAKKTIMAEKWTTAKVAAFLTDKVRLPFPMSEGVAGCFMRDLEIPRISKGTHGSNGEGIAGRLARVENVLRFVLPVLANAWNFNDESHQAIIQAVRLLNEASPTKE